MKKKLIHDIANKRVITEGDSVVAFTTENLECTQEVIDKVVELYNNATEGQQLFGSGGIMLGIIDEFLLNSPDCYQEDREEILEQLFDFFESKTKTANEVINEIAEVLREWDGKDLERIANQILTKKVKYIEDSIFEVGEYFEVDE